MADIRKVITGNALNQGAATLGVQRADATITKLDSQASQWSIESIESGYDARFDDYGLRRKTIELGDWDMDATDAVEISHGLINNQWKGTRSVELIIRNDADTVYYDDSASAENVFVSGVGATVLTLDRLTGGTFDGTDFNATSYNRGWATIWYE